MTYIAWFSELNRDDIATAGGKGANLGELTQAGFPVPAGFVVTTDGYADAVTACGLRDAILARARTVDADDLAAAGRAAADIAQLFTRVAIPAELAEEILAAYHQLDHTVTGTAAAAGVAVAVRSSATAEDLPGASFAGQQDTYLNVHGDQALLAGVHDCWASLWTERALAYRAQRGIEPASVKLAVVIQRLVTADAAGVMFTANPTNGRRDQTLLTAAWGLGESVVGGSVDTDTVVVDVGRQIVLSRETADKAVMTVTRPSGTVEVVTPESRRRATVLTDQDALALADIGARVQAHYGTAQDIEWAREGDEVLLVQARPVTALPGEAGPVPTDWPVPHPSGLYFRASIVEQMPDPLSPLFADLVRPAVVEGLAELFGEVFPGGERLEIDFPTINGFAFYEYSRSAFWTMLKLTPRVVPLLAKGAGAWSIHRWHDQSLPRYREIIAAWAARDASAMTAAELLSGVQELLDAGCAYYTSVQAIIPVAATAELGWSGFYNTAIKRPGDPAAEVFLLGEDSEPIRAEKSLSALADWCGQHPDLTGALQTVSPEALSGPPPEGVEAATWDQWRARFAAHLAAYGHTVYNLDFVNPVAADDPGPVLAALRFSLSGRSTDPATRQARLIARREAAEAEVLGRLGPVRRRIATRLIAAARRTAPIREDALAAMGLAWPRMRHLLREFGSRAVQAGGIEEPFDICWLNRDEAEALAVALDASPADQVDPGHAAGPVGPVGLPDRRAAVAQRQALWRNRRLATPPQYLPLTRWMALMDDMLPARNEAQTGTVIKGTGGSGGRVTGPARVLSGPTDFVAFRPGEVLVASITTPAYTPLFARAAAVVTDIGGVLSHGSIVAREYGIPAVLGTGVATRRIATGDEVTVDGTAGVVLLPGAEANDTADPEERADRQVRPPGSVPVRIRALVIGGLALSAVGLARWWRVRCRPSHGDHPTSA
ncbi:MAG: PEP/pyruvate-binding domain-containing protein [Dermatophilaceae bacterium]